MPVAFSAAGADRVARQTCFGTTNLVFVPPYFDAATDRRGDGMISIEVCIDRMASLKLVAGQLYSTTHVIS